MCPVTFPTAIGMDYHKRSGPQKQKSKVSPIGSNQDGCFLLEAPGENLFPVTSSSQRLLASPGLWQHHYNLGFPHHSAHTTHSEPSSFLLIMAIVIIASSPNSFSTTSPSQVLSHKGPFAISGNQHAQIPGI